MPAINKPSEFKIWAATGSAIAPTDEKYSEGWVVEAPPHQTFNYLLKKHDTAIAHCNQYGFFEWDAVTEYQANKSWTLGSNGSIYFCKVTHTNVNPVTDVAESNWRKVMDGNSVVTFPLVSAYVKNTFFPSADAATARTNLGITSTGSNVVTAASTTAARTALGSGAVGDQVFVAASGAIARTAIGVVDADDSTKGLVQRATDVEAIAGVEDTKFLTPKKLKLGFSVSLSGNGFVNFPSWLGGVIFRWGSVTLGSNSQTTVTTFPHSCLSGQVSIASTSTDASQAMNVAASGTNLIVTNPESSSRYIYWFAIGY